jgi:hypothetical protein
VRTIETGREKDDAALPESWIETSRKKELSMSDVTGNVTGRERDAPELQCRGVRATRDHDGSAGKTPVDRRAQSSEKIKKCSKIRCGRRKYGVCGVRGPFIVNIA